MKLAIKNKNGNVYIDKNLDRVDEEGNRLFPDEVLTQEPYNYTIIELDDKYADCEAVDFNQDLSFDIDKYNLRRQKMALEDTKNKIVSLIREKYSIDDEMAILRQRDTKPNEYQAYYNFVEECKRKVKEDL